MVQHARATKRRQRAGANARGSASLNGASKVAPGGKAWAGRFSQPTDAAVEAFTSSIDLDARLVPDDIAASIAHARMLGRQRIIPRKDADAIVRGLAEILQEHARGDFVLRADLEDVHMNVEARLAEKIGEPAGRLHTARSRNDQIATDFRMYVKSACARAIDALLRLETALLDLAQANKTVVMPGYTHLQRAQPVLLAHHLLAYCEMLERDAARFAFAFDMADELPLGSGALAGVPYPIDREYVAEQLSFSRVSENSIDAVSGRDFAVDYAAAAALAMVHLSRLAEELVLWSSAEFAFIRLPDAFATGSSIMPQKKNADVAELTRGRSGRAIGALMSLLTMLKGLPLAYNRDLQEDKRAVFEAEDTLLPALDVLAAMLPAIEVDAKRARRAAVASYSLATDYADYLTRKGLPFREAHHAVGKLVRYAEDNNMDLSRLSLEELRGFSPLFDDDATRIDVNSALRSRDVIGGTAPRPVTAALRRARKRVEAMRAGTAPSVRKR